MIHAKLGAIALGAIFSAVLAVPATLVVSAQDATPIAAGETASEFVVLEVPLSDAEGNEAGKAIFSEYGGQILVQVNVTGLTPGEHGWHLHETGICDPAGAEPFALAGEHWNPTEMPHGAPDAPEHHAGDFGNIPVREDGIGESTIATSAFTLGDGPTSVLDEDGTAIIIHEGTDDLVSQPSGESGARFACGVVAAPIAGATPLAGAPAATPVA